MIQDAHEQHEIEGFAELGHVVHRQLVQFELHAADLGRKACLRQIQGLAINPHHALSATAFHLNRVEPAIAANIEDRLAVQVGWQGIGKALPFHPWIIAEKMLRCRLEPTQVQVMKPWAEFTNMLLNLLCS